MSSLSQKLMLLFLFVAMVIVLLVSIVINLDWLTTLKRLAIGGFLFSIIGGMIGQLLSNNLDINGDLSGNIINEEVVSNKKTNISDDLSQDNGEDMVPLEFQKLNEEEETMNIINEDTDKIAEVIQGMSK
ncbi:hypothetical protein [Orenia marismortui]|uniref:Uncharacterized protein n=1 Tax=Orenia marismortui TaxID=46469 RepID=A0A4R8GZ48_9FIRM|nr:hypothetical protein [Orenia marismortui]TDX51907.1 hypothetical protein C7959_10930 [Orenia marismortui]